MFKLHHRQHSTIKHGNKQNNWKTLRLGNLIVHLTTFEILALIFTQEKLKASYFSFGTQKYSIDRIGQPIQAEVKPGLCFSFQLSCTFCFDRLLDQEICAMFRWD